MGRGDDTSPRLPHDESGSRNDSRTDPFIRPRTVIGIALVGAVIFLATLDAIRSDYVFDTVQMSLMLGTATVVLGVEPLKRILRGD